MKDFALTAAIGLGLIVGTGIAAHAGMDGSPQSQPWHPLLNSQQKEQIFPKLQQLQLDHIKAKEQQLQADERCFAVAGSYDKLQLCQKASWQATRAERQSFRDSLSSLYLQQGITLREGMKR